MAAPASPPVTSVTATLADLAAFIAAHGTSGVYIYTDSGQTPTGAGVAASTFGTDADMLAYYEGLTAVQTSATVVAAVQAANHVFPTTPNRKARVKNKTIVWTTTAAAAADMAAIVNKDTVLYVSEKGYQTDTNLFYKILDGTYVNKYIKHEDVEFLLHDTSV